MIWFLYNIAFPIYVVFGGIGLAFCVIGFIVVLTDSRPARKDLIEIFQAAGVILVWPLFIPVGIAWVVRRCYWIIVNDRTPPPFDWRRYVAWGNQTQ